VPRSIIRFAIFSRYCRLAGKHGVGVYGISVQNDRSLTWNTPVDSGAGA
jgi:O-glycosyl hydrolase